MYTELGNQLKQYRKESNLTIGQVAYAVDEPASEVELWESGQLKPSGVTKMRLEYLYNHIGDEHKELERINEDNYSAFLDFVESDAIPREFTLWLKAHGFFIAPASLSYHGKQSGGLYFHSLAVAQELIKYTEELGLQWNRAASPWIVGMFHDLCKTDEYLFNWNNGKWEWNKSQIHNGHGEKSVIMLQRHIKLNEQEIACIRWHMGAFTDQKEWEYYGRAIERYPTVLYTHTADMHTSRVLGV